MKGSQKFLAGLLIGAAAGAALALFLKSDKGQELLAKAKECTNDFADSLKGKCEAMKEDQSEEPTETAPTA